MKQIVVVRQFRNVLFALAAATFSVASCGTSEAVSTAAASPNATVAAGDLLSNSAAAIELFFDSGNPYGLGLADEASLPRSHGKVTRTAALAWVANRKQKLESVFQPEVVAGAIDAYTASAEQAASGTEAEDAPVFLSGKVTNAKLVSQKATADGDEVVVVADVIAISGYPGRSTGKRIERIDGSWQFTLTFAGAKIAKFDLRFADSPAPGGPVETRPAPPVPVKAPASVPPVRGTAGPSPTQPAP